MNWKNHLYGDKENPGLLKQLSQGLGILKKIRHLMPENKFRNIAASIFTSKLIYCITVWGGVWGLSNSPKCNYTTISKEDMRKLQVLQNKLMRLESGLDYETPTKTLLEHCNYLSVHQLVAYHSGLQISKIVASHQPKYHFNRLQNINTRESRATLDNRTFIDFKLSTGRSSFFYQASRIWNLIPEDIKSIEKMLSFKKALKKWVIQHISIKPQA